MEEITAAVAATITVIVVVIVDQTLVGKIAVASVRTVLTAISTQEGRLNLSLNLCSEVARS
jgi:hypothetical protein